MRIADIILTSSDTWISRAIRRFGKEKGEEALVSHAGIFIDGHHVLEALFRGVVTTTFPDDFQKDEYAIFTPLNLTGADRLAICKRAMSFSARSYGYTKILGQLFDYTTNTDWFTSKIFTWDRYPVCSYVVAEGYSFVGKNFGVPSKSTTPDDLLDFCFTRTDKYQLIQASQGMMDRMKEVYRRNM